MTLCCENSHNEIFSVTRFFTLYQYAQKSNTVPVGINLEWCISSSKSHTSVHLCEISKTNKKS